MRGMHDNSRASLESVLKRERKQKQPDSLQPLSLFLSVCFIPLLFYTSFTSDRSFDGVEQLSLSRFGTEVDTFTFSANPVSGKMLY